MSQLTLRIPEAVVPELKRAAAAAGKSLNAWIASVLSAAVDPDLAGPEADAVRERLARAGILMPPAERPVRRPRAVEVARARARAGQGQPLAKLVSEGRS